MRRVAYLFILMALFCTPMKSNDEQPFSFLGPEFKDYKRFSVPGHFMRPGIIYTIDEKTRTTQIVLDVGADLSPTERDKMIVRSSPTSMLTVKSDKSSAPLVATLLEESLGMDRKLAREAASGATLRINNVFTETLSLTAFSQTFSKKNEIN